MKEIYDILAEVRRRPNERLAMATLVRTFGSSYRRAGARMLICEDGTIVGSLSAGCLEEEVALRAQEVRQTGKPAVMTFDTRRRFGCAGAITIFIERVAEEIFANISRKLDARQSCLMVTTFDGDLPGTRIESAPGTDASGSTTNQLTHVIHPTLRLFVIGDGADSAPFLSFGRLLGWQTIQVADSNMIDIASDEWTAAIVKSHNYGRDFVALQRLLPLNLKYVGLIGPRKRRDQIMNELLDVGVTMNAGFFAPAGLDLGAETPDEIALSVIAEIQRVFGETSGDSLRERKTRIHDLASGGDDAPAPASLTG